jgi:putative FmdB family regulatory protein
MPTYQYACTNAECGNDFELVQSFTDPAATECPICGQPVRKRFGSVGVVFKGSGFYRTDSRAESKSHAKSSSNGAAKSDKAAAKTESTPSSSSSGESKSPAASGSGSSGQLAASA